MQREPVELESRSIRKLLLHQSGRRTGRKATVSNSHGQQAISIRLIPTYPAIVSLLVQG